MYHITTVSIDGFWGKYSPSTEFSPEVNIIIGKNGTGKTHFINLLQGALKADLKLLASLFFRSMTIRLEDDNGSRRTIKVEKQEKKDLPYELLSYKIGSFSYKFPIDTNDSRRPLFRHRPRHEEEYARLKKQLQDLVNISGLTVYRSGFDNSTEEKEFGRRDSKEIPAIDLALNELVQQLTAYQLTLERNADLISKAFQKDVLKSVLYDEKFDTFDLGQLANIRIAEETKGLSNAYRELGMLDKSMSERIDAHFKILKNSIDNLKKSSNSFRIDDITPIPLLKRTQHIIDLSLKAALDKQQIFEPINLFFEILKEFIGDKKVTFSQFGYLTVYKGDEKIELSDLSSGEKQLIIILSLSLLQRNQQFIFLADEPELSLHIEWQAEIISSIKRLNSNSQIIMATHSPEISGSWTNANVIDMEDILHA